MNLRHFAFLRPLLLPLALLTLAGSALALNSPDEEVTVRKLTAEEILEITIDKTWVIDFDNVAMTSTTCMPPRPCTALRLSLRPGMLSSDELLLLC